MSEGIDQGRQAKGVAIAHEKWLISTVMLGFCGIFLATALWQGSGGITPYVDRINIPPTPGWRENFATYFVAIVLEGAPYMVLSALAAALIEMFVPPGFLPRFAARLGGWGIPVVVLASPLFPICECGIGFVARRLLRLGLPLPHTLGYLLAAPILNPLVFTGTWLAFGQNLVYPVLRGAGAILVALAVALLFMRLSRAQAVTPELEHQLVHAERLERLRNLVPVFVSSLVSSKHDPCCSHEGDSGCEHSNQRQGVGDRIRHVLAHVREDFLDTGSYFLMGVFVASLMKTFIHPAWIEASSKGDVSGPAVMMLLAFVLSLCAGADAFVVASFVEFDVSAHMAFLVLGPMLDIKLLFMYRTIFRGGFIVRFVVAILVGVILYVALLQSLPKEWLEWLADRGMNWQGLL